MVRRPTYAPSPRTCACTPISSASGQLMLAAARKPQDRGWCLLSRAPGWRRSPSGSSGCSAIRTPRLASSHPGSEPPASQRRRRCHCEADVPGAVPREPCPQSTRWSAHRPWRSLPESSPTRRPWASSSAAAGAAPRSSRWRASCSPPLAGSPASPPPRRGLCGAAESAGSRRPQCSRRSSSRLGSLRPQSARYAVRRPEAVVRYLGLRYALRDQEVLGALYVNARHELMAERELYRGTLHRAAVEPRAILREALVSGAAGVVLWYTHRAAIRGRARRISPSLGGWSGRPRSWA